MSINIKTLKEMCKEFRKIEGRASFYDIAIEIVDSHPLQAVIIILATWNVGRFRFMVSNPQNLIDLKNALEKYKPLFKKVKSGDFQTVNFDKIGKTVKQIYSLLSKVKGVEYTGASKIMHLLNPNLFVMRDNGIRKKYKVEVNPKDFLEFQKLMQKLFGNIKWDEPTKALPKAIDEYNYVKYTFPELKKRRQF